MQTRRHLQPAAVTFAFIFCLAGFVHADDAPTPREQLNAALIRWADLVETNSPPQTDTLTAHLQLTRSNGLMSAVENAGADIAFQAPDRLRIAATAGDFKINGARDRQTIWIDEISKKFAVLGKPGMALFQAEPNRLDTTHVGPFALPISRLKLRMLTLMLDVTAKPVEIVDGAPCDVLAIELLPAAAQIMGDSGGHGKIWIRQSDGLPARITYADGENLDIQVDISRITREPAWADDRWQLQAADGEDVQTTAVGHLMRFFHVIPKIMRQSAEPLGPATGDRELVASEGAGRLETIDQTHVLFLKGTPEQMGRQQGVLMRDAIHDLCERVLYGVGVGSSFDRGKWFFSEIENAEGRLEPHMDKRYLAEMDAMADASQMDRQEARLSNFFPELFHCTGFSLYGKAVNDGHMYHGRVLDYLRGVGLEQNAVVVVYQPSYGNAWVNLGYAGFIGSVTAMNEKGISIGEMGGDGYGEWDGKPMAELLREVMEKANTLDDAIRIMRDSPRTCHYYYVISDGKTKQAVGIEATPSVFRVVHAGEAVPELPHAFDDAVLLSAGDRYKTLCNRVTSGYGSFDRDAALRLMSRPVCMTSNIQSVLFRPDTLDFWVANADSQHVASATRFTHYNLRELLRSEKPLTKYEAAKRWLGRTLATE